MSTPIQQVPPPQPQHRLHTPKNEGLQALLIHAAVSLVIGTYTFALEILHDLPPDVTLGLFGTIVGAHVTAAASAQIHRRRTDGET